MPSPQLPVTLQSTLSGLPPVPELQPVNGGGTFLQSTPYNEEQQRALQNLLQMGGQRLAQPTQGFQPFEDRARQQFQTQTIPSLAERFTALGGGQRSSGFQQALGQAGSDLESQLAQSKAQYGLQSENQALNMLQMGLTPQYNQQYNAPADIAGTLGQQTTGAGMDLMRAFISAPGNSFGEKLRGMFSGGNPLAQAAIPAMAGAAGAAAPVAIGSAASSAIPAATGAAIGGAALGTGASKLGALAGAPAALAGAATPAATTTAAGLSTLASQADIPAAAGVAGATAPSVLAPAAASGASSSIAPALASFGSVAMPAAFLSVLGYALWKGVLEPDKERPEQFRNRLPDGNWFDSQGNKVVSKGDRVIIYDDNGNIIDQQKFAKPYKSKNPKSEKSDTIVMHYGKDTPQATYYRNNPKGV